MTFLITASFVLTAVYVVAAFLYHCTASICIRHRATIKTVTEVMEAIAAAPLLQDCYQEIEKVTISEPAAKVTKLLHKDENVTIPQSIRGLRDYVRAENLQTAIKQLTGKSVSSLTKPELMEAVQMAIA